MGVTPQPPVKQPEAPALIPTADIIASILRAVKNTSDLIFSPGRAPQAETSGQLVQLKIPGVGVLTAEHTARIAADLIGRNTHAVDKLKQEGSCDISYSLPQYRALPREHFHAARKLRDRHARDRQQRAGFQDAQPSAAAWRKRPNWVRAWCWSPDPRAAANPPRWPPSSTRSTKKRPATSSPSKIPSSFCTRTSAPRFISANCTPILRSFALALRAALRQAPKLILVGEMRDRETIEVALEAAETGHLVYSTLHTIDASKTIERIVGVFPAERSARHPHAPGEKLPLHHFAAPDSHARTAAAAWPRLKS